MHYRLEVILPPTDDIEAAIAEVMAPFSECLDDDDENKSSFTFWDWYQLGGRYSGRKLEQAVGEEKVDAFRKVLNEKNVTVSGLVWGKQELSPASQIPMVDALWREMCPGGGDVCPMFKHSGEGVGSMDICTLDQMPEETTALAVIIAGHSYDGTKLEAKYMIHDSMWNGVMHVETQWDKKVKSALDDWVKKLSNYAEAYKQKHMPQRDWLVVTVDYHS